MAFRRRLRLRQREGAVDVRTSETRCHWRACVKIFSRWQDHRSTLLVVENQPGFDAQCGKSKADEEVRGPVQTIATNTDADFHSLFRGFSRDGKSKGKKMSPNRKLS